MEYPTRRASPQRTNADFNFNFGLTHAFISDGRDDNDLPFIGDDDPYATLDEDDRNGIILDPAKTMVDRNGLG